MQYYALENNFSVLATSAKKGKSYLCPECSTPVRLRSGPHRQPHFYHLKKTPQCKQSQKSLAHLQVQKTICDLLPAQEGQLEQAFQEIDRIADVSWDKKKIIYEVQCSPISLEEAQDRCRDYQSIGVLPVWILHDKRFNQKRLSAAEKFLRTQHCYFTNIDERGEGIIYNQHEIVQNHTRIFRGEKIAVDLQNPASLYKITPPLQIKRPFSFSRLYRSILYLLLEST